MKRAILRLTAEEFGRSSLNLGRADENIAVRVEIDLSRILAQEPTATAHINVENPSGTEYAAVTSMDGTKLIWDVKKADNTIEGTGCAQLTVKGPNGEVLKSAVAATRVGHSIRGEGPAPDPVQNWVDDATNKLGSVVQVGEEAKKATDKANAAAKSANTAAENAQTIADTVQAKLDNGDFNGKDGAPGKDGEQGPQGEPGSDASVTADNIHAALGYTPVKDVYLNGESLVQDSVATIPLAGYNRLGAIQLDPAGFAAASVEGKLALVPPTDAQISTHTYTQRPITPSCMDYAVKAAMCDGKGAAWTAAEQQAARERIGMDGKYVLIEETTLTEETAQVEREQEPDGTPYNFDAIKVIVKFVPGQANGAFFCFSQSNNIRIVGGASQKLSMPSSSSAAYFRSVAVFNAKPGYGGLYDCDIAAGSQGSAMAVTRASGGAYIMTDTSQKIQNIQFYLYFDVSIPMIAVTEISIYGVRA